MPHAGHTVQALHDKHFMIWSLTLVALVPFVAPMSENSAAETPPPRRQQPDASDAASCPICNRHLRSQDPFLRRRVASFSLVNCVHTDSRHTGKDAISISDISRIAIVADAGDGGQIARRELELMEAPCCSETPARPRGAMVVQRKGVEETGNGVGSTWFDVGSQGLVDEHDSRVIGKCGASPTPAATPAIPHFDRP
jgi:hypothetical protein